jgi:hypothetical protein
MNTRTIFESEGWYFPDAWDRTGLFGIVGGEKGFTFLGVKQISVPLSFQNLRIIEEDSVEFAQQGLKRYLLFTGSEYQYCHEIIASSCSIS